LAGTAPDVRRAAHLQPCFSAISFPSGHPTTRETSLAKAATRVASIENHQIRNGTHPLRENRNAQCFLAPLIRYLSITAKIFGWLAHLRTWST